MMVYRHVKICVAVIGPVVALSLGMAPSVYASSSEKCTDVEAVFARGSGQGLVADEFKDYRDYLQQYLDEAEIASNLYELGSEQQAGSDGVTHKYPAVAVVGWTNGGYLNALGAKFSGGLGNDYGKSVEDGTKELVLYLNQRFGSVGSCHDSRIILSGYSQGAQVIGQTITSYSEEIEDSVRERIDYVALFGDPKLYLPEGYDLLLGEPDACKPTDDEDYYHSYWRQTVPSCYTYEGALGMRDPYTKEEFVVRTGTWCNELDVVCDTNNNVFNTSNDGHGKYPAQGRIEEGVRESLLWVANALSDPAKGLKLKHAVRNNGISEPDTDETKPLPYTPENLMEYYRDPDTPDYYDLPCHGYVAVDVWQPYTTMLVRPYPSAETENLRFSSALLTELFLNEGCDVEIYQYNSLAVIPAFTLVQTSSRDMDTLNRALYKIPVKAIQQSIYTTRCKPGQQNRISYRFFRDIVIGDHPNPTDDTLYGISGDYESCGRDEEAINAELALYDQYDAHKKYHGWSGSSLLTYYGISSQDYSYESHSATPLEEQTISTARVARVMNEAKLPSGDMTIVFPYSTYYPNAGEKFTFSVKPYNPLVTAPEYKLFAWDYDSDGEIDDLTDTPTASHVFNDIGTTTLTVTGITQDDEYVQARARVVVSAKDSASSTFHSAKPAAPKDLMIYDVGGGSIEVTWQPADTLADTWMVQVNDSPGTRVNVGSSYLVTITDIDVSRPLTIRVRGITSDGYLGEIAMAGLSKEGVVTTQDEFANMLKEMPLFEPSGSDGGAASDEDADQSKANKSIDNQTDGVGARQLTPVQQLTAVIAQPAAPWALIGGLSALVFAGVIYGIRAAVLRHRSKGVNKDK